MKTYQKFEMDVLVLEDDIVRTSVEQEPLDDPLSQYDDVISDF